MNRTGNVSKSVNLRLPGDLFEGVEKSANEGYYSSVPDFIRQTLRDRIKEELK